MLVPLTGRHHHNGEKEILEEQSIFDSVEEEAVARGKNSDLFIMLHSYALFRIERHDRSCFSLTFGIKVVGFCLCLMMFFERKYGFS